MKNKVAIGEVVSPSGFKGHFRINSFTEKKENFFKYGPVFINDELNKINLVKIKSLKEMFIVSCENEQASYNPYIPDISFERVINLNLPSFDNINYTGGSVELEGLGVCGVILFNFNNDILFLSILGARRRRPGRCPRRAST